MNEKLYTLISNAETQRRKGWGFSRLVPGIFASSRESFNAVATRAALVCAFAAVSAAAAPIGFADTRGGLDGRVLKVTSLESAGPGTLREALDAKGPRVIVFEVAGVIDLNKKELKVIEPFVTVAGETAPSPGITLIRAGVSIEAHDVVMRHIRIRPGDAGAEKNSGWEPDGLCVEKGVGHNVVIDQCSLSWAIDENLSATGPRTEGPDATAHRVTFSNCIIAEALSRSSHEKGEHSMGSLIHDFCRDIAIIGNLYAHNRHRNPLFKAHCTGVVVNNVIYDPGNGAIQLEFMEQEWTHAKMKPANSRVSVVGNVLLHGASTNPKLALVGKQGDAYLEDNLAFRRDGSPAPLVAGAITQLTEKPVWPEGLRALPSDQVVDAVAKRAGARPKDRDETDRRIVNNLLERKGRIIDSQDDVGGYPVIEKRERKLDVPADNIEAWLKEHAAAVE